jgi:hypothetical protein
VVTGEPFSQPTPPGASPSQPMAAPVWGRSRRPVSQQRRAGTASRSRAPGGALVWLPAVPRSCDVSRQPRSCCPPWVYRWPAVPPFIGDVSRPPVPRCPSRCAPWRVLVAGCSAIYWRCEPAASTPVPGRGVPMCTVVCIGGWLFRSLWAM